MTDNIKPDHYHKGEIDLFESWYLTYPFNEFRAIMCAVAERYMKRDKDNRIQDLDKAMETLRRLKEYEEREKYKNTVSADNELHYMDLKFLQECGYKYITRNSNDGLRAHKHLPLRIGDHWLSVGYYDRGLIQFDLAENKVIEISDLLSSYEKM